MNLKQLVFFGLVSLAACSACRAVDNPLRTALDGAMINYQGSYYGIGAQGAGMAVASTNLLDWSEPVPVFGPERLDKLKGAGASDLIYRNGLFHLYVGNKGYAMSSAPLGPFSDFVKAGLVGRSMRMLQDEAGGLMAAGAVLGTKKEGEVWLQAFSAPWQTTGKPVRLLDGRRGMWDALDSADICDPELLACRGRYYLLYAANSASPRVGLRELGVAVDERPDRIRNTGKLPAPVLSRNVERLSRTYPVILPSAEYAPWEGRYTLKDPGAGWQQPDFRMAGWRSDKGGFGSPDRDGDAEIHACRTKWTTDAIWIRREFNWKKGAPQRPVLKIRHERSVQVFLNGQLIYEAQEPSLAYINVETPAAARLIRPEGNVLAVHAVAGGKDAEFRFIDFGLYDAGDAPPEPTVYGLSKPKVVTGPNGFEKWLLYQAYWNGVPGSGLDRIFFYGDELVIDGPTTAGTPGYHPPPAPPTFREAFPAGAAWTARWTAAGGTWTATNGVLVQSDGAAPARVMLKTAPARNYLFETYLRLPAAGQGRAGVVAWSDGAQELLITIDPVRKTWAYQVQPGGAVEKQYKLPSQFRDVELPPGVKGAASAFHRLRIIKNGGYFDVLLDDFKLTHERPIQTAFKGAGRPGLFCAGSPAEFGGAVYTVGWDEYDAYITGWGAAADGTPPSGDWRLETQQSDWREHVEKGLVQKKHSENGLAFKGDLLESYEFTVNARTERLEEGDDKLYGVFPVFVDRDNYLRAAIDGNERKLVVSGKRGGKDIGPWKASLARRVPYRHLYDTETAYRDVAAWVYELRSESIVSGLDVRWLEGEYKYLQQEFFLPSDSLTLQYAYIRPYRQSVILWDDGRFNDADEPKPVTHLSAVHNPVRIRPVKANYISIGTYQVDSIIINSETGAYIRPYTAGSPPRSGEEVADDYDFSGDPARPQETLIHLDLESSYFFRCVKLADKVLIELNGEPALAVEGNWPPAQVGLFTDGLPCAFNGITLMDLSTQKKEQQ